MPGLEVFPNRLCGMAYSCFFTLTCRQCACRRLGCLETGTLRVSALYKEHGCVSPCRPAVLHARNTLKSNDVERANDLDSVMADDGRQGRWRSPVNPRQRSIAKVDQAFVVRRFLQTRVAGCSDPCREP